MLREVQKQIVVRRATAHGRELTEFGTPSKQLGVDLGRRAALQLLRTRHNDLSVHLIEDSARKRMKILEDVSMRVDIWRGGHIFITAPQRLHHLRGTIHILCVCVCDTTASFYIGKHCRMYRKREITAHHEYTSVSLSLCYMCLYLYLSIYLYIYMDIDLPYTVAYEGKEEKQ